MAQYALFSVSCNGELFRLEQVWTFQTPEKLFDELVSFMLEQDYIQDKLEYTDANIEKIAERFVSDETTQFYMIEISNKRCGHYFSMDTAKNLKALFKQ